MCSKDSRKKNCENENVSILTLNLRFGLADDGKNSWQYRKKVLPSLFNKYRKDFIGFQEANSFQIDYINNILAEYNFIGERKPAPSFWQNNIIFFKKPWECIYYNHFFLSHTPETPSRFRKSCWPRQCTMGIFKNNDRRIICTNTHFDFCDSVQVKSAKLVVQRLSLLPEKLPVILIGDFNATPQSSCYRIFTGTDQQENIKKPLLKDVFKKPYPGTHHGFTGNINGDYIDWILYRGNIVPEDWRVIHDTINGIYPSDHFPVCATFRWVE